MYVVQLCIGPSQHGIEHETVSCMVKINPREHARGQDSTYRIQTHACITTAGKAFSESRNAHETLCMFRTWGEWLRGAYPLVRIVSASCVEMSPCSNLRLTVALSRVGLLNPRVLSIRVTSTPSCLFIVRVAMMCSASVLVMSPCASFRLSVSRTTSTSTSTLASSAVDGMAVATRASLGPIIVPFNDNMARERVETYAGLSAGRVVVLGTSSVGRGIQLASCEFTS